MMSVKHRKIVPKAVVYPELLSGYSFSRFVCRRLAILHRAQSLAQMRFASVKGTIHHCLGSHPDAHGNAIERGASRRGAKT